MKHGANYKISTKKMYSMCIDTYVRYFLWNYSNIDLLTQVVKLLMYLSFRCMYGLQHTLHACDLSTYGLMCNWHITAMYRFT